MSCQHSSQKQGELVFFQDAETNLLLRQCLRLKTFSSSQDNVYSRNPTGTNDIKVYLKSARADLAGFPRAVREFARGEWSSWIRVGHAGNPFFCALQVEKNFSMQQILFIVPTGLMNTLLWAVLAYFTFPYKIFRAKISQLDCRENLKRGARKVWPARINYMQ